MAKFDIATKPHESIKSNEKVSPPEFPHLKRYVAKTLGHPPNERELLEFFFSKHPNSASPNDQEYIPRAESMLHSLNNIPHNRDRFIKLLDQYGVVGSSDGIKIAIIDKNVDSQTADAIILNNIELLLSTADELKIDIILGKYSGDEDIFMLAPRHKNQFDGSRDNLRENFDTLLKQKIEQSYKKPFFAKAREALIQSGVDQQLGLKAKYINPHFVRPYVPNLYKKDQVSGKLTFSKVATPRLKHVMGSIIDATAGLTSTIDTTSLDFIDYLKSTKDQNIDEVLQNADLENMYSKKLHVKKIATLEKDIKKRCRHNPSEQLYLVRLADIYLKLTNALEGHTKGDHHMIAVASMVRRLVEENDLPPSSVEIYQHNGSLLLTLSEGSYNRLSNILNDPVFLNDYFNLSESKRSQLEGQNPRLRASPFVVASTSTQRDKDQTIPVTIDIHNINTIWEKVNKLQEAQLVNETLVSLYISGLANRLPEHFIRISKDLLIQQGITPSQIDQFLLDTSLYLSVFSDYHSQRPLYFQKVIDYLTTNELISDEQSKHLNRIKRRLQKY